MFSYFCIVINNSYGGFVGKGFHARGSWTNEQYEISGQARQLRQEPPPRHHDNWLTAVSVAAVYRENTTVDINRGSRVRTREIPSTVVPFWARTQNSNAPCVRRRREKRQGKTSCVRVCVRARVFVYAIVLGDNCLFGRRGIFSRKIRSAGAAGVLFTLSTYLLDLIKGRIVAFPRRFNGLARVTLRAVAAPSLRP